MRTQVVYSDYLSQDNKQILESILTEFPDMKVNMEIKTNGVAPDPITKTLELKVTNNLNEIIQSNIDKMDVLELINLLKVIYQNL